MKYSILMPYYDRPLQLQNTLESFVQHYGQRNDFEVVIIEDAKNATSPPLHHQLMEVLHDAGSGLLWKVRPYTEVFYNPAPLYNIGAEEAQGTYLLLTNPECRHTTDILSGLDEEFDQDPDCYVVCGCEALDKQGVHYMWYQHSEYRNKEYHFCSALSQYLFYQVGGFPEALAEGYAYDDDVFRLLLKQADIPFVHRDDLLVEHQWHKKTRPPDWQHRKRKNKKLYERMVKEAAQ